METDNFDSFVATCERFVNVAQYDAAHLDVVGAFHRLAELHKREIAAKDSERLTVVANYENVIAAKDRIIAAKDAEIAELERKYADACKCCDDAERRLKVAEDALEKVYKCVDNKRDVDVSLLVKSIIADKLAAIRGEGANDGK